MTESYDEKRALLQQRLDAERHKIEVRSRNRMQEITAAADRRESHSLQASQLRTQAHIEATKLRADSSVETLQLQLQQAPQYSDIEFNDFVRRENIRLQGLTTELGIRNRFSDLEHQRLLDQALDTTIAQVVLLSLQAFLERKEIKLRHTNEVHLRFLDHDNTKDLDLFRAELARQFNGLSDEAANELGRKIAEEMEADRKSD